MPSRKIIINHYGRLYSIILLASPRTSVSCLQCCQTISRLLWVSHLISLEADDPQAIQSYRHTLTHRHFPTEDLKTKEEKWNPFWNGGGKSINYCNYFNSHCRKDPNKGLVSSCKHTCLLWSLRGPRLFLSTILT